MCSFEDEASPDRKSVSISLFLVFNFSNSLDAYNAVFSIGQGSTCLTGSLMLRRRRRLDVELGFEDMINFEYGIRNYAGEELRCCNAIKRICSRIKLNRI